MVGGWETGEKKYLGTDRNAARRLVRIATLAARGSLLGALLLASSCAPSEEDVQREFDAFVAEANRCEAASECVLATAGCPLGCSVAVNAGAKADVERKARELIEDFESDGTHCEYDCAAISSIECTDGRCAIVR
jgi:hypothetical protein